MKASMDHEQLNAEEVVSLKTALYLLSRELLENSTGHGLERIVRAKEWYRSVSWFIIFMLGMVWFCYEIYLVVTTYLAFGVTVSVGVTYMPKFEFPAVTVCNANMLKKSSIGNSASFSSLPLIDLKYKTAYCTSYAASCTAYDPSWDGSSNGNSLVTTMPPSGNNTMPLPFGNNTMPLPSGNNTMPLPSRNNTLLPPGNDTNFLTLPPPTNNNGRRKRDSFSGIGSNGGNGGNGGNVLNSQNSKALGDFQFNDRGFTGITSDTDFESFMDQSQTQDFSDLSTLLKPTSEELDVYGIKSDEFILQCSYDQTNCTYLDFAQVQNSVYGNCYTFHPSSMNGSDSLITTHYGLQYGLRLSLNIQSKEYVGLFSQNVGVRMSVHPFNVTPFPENDGVSAMPGILTQVGVTLTTISRQPSPYPSNCTDGTDVDLIVDGQYTIWACEVTCLQSNLYSACGCQDQVITNVTRCQLSNKTQEICRQKIYFLYEEGLLGCSCPSSCYDVNYDTSVNSMSWPSDPYMYIMGERLMNDNPKAKELLDNNDLHNSIVSNVVRLHVYIKDPNVYSIVEQPAYEWENLLADVGGLSGLCLGFSALSTFEFLEYFVDLFAVITKRLWMPHRSQISPSRSIMSIPLGRSHTSLMNHQGGTLAHEYSA